jgi:hypothetical protein
MRAPLRGSFVIVCLAALLAAACDAPPPPDPVGAAVVEPPPPRDPLPEAVAATVHKLREIARHGAYRDMATLAEATPDFRSNNAGMSHKDYWYLKMRAGDWPMAQAQKLLDYRFAIADGPQGKVYIWPWMAKLKPEEITPSAARDIDRLLGDGQAELLRKGAIWPGYVLGIAEDGAWLYFVSGTG